MLSEKQRWRFQDYCNTNKSVFSNRVVKDFFRKDDHILLLLFALDGDHASQSKLNEKFRKHFFRIRFITFIVSTIKYCTLDQLRLYQKNDMRYQLIFDRPASEEGDATPLGELLLGSQCANPSEPPTSDPAEFQSSLINECLANAFSKLSPKQQVITTLGYSMCYKDNEIAQILGVSQQAVCKTRNLALQKLRVALPERR
ncbi:sigma-70 family RNA polymerase sigma factor [Paenibacillus apiarius]|uniref:Sigma-70 family RNA polymerase sigma factor n=1 Tax=Paenibacillus apiarius TaxID=46240 RepID=A0ABT4DZB3_9BACL|nr:sigma-70 family RNA polymerase sigma factor [Paenibacillus apiarius]MCY9517854.1 sigma-70 family RNA polymerase sigma factor [Paenibacillus apiarius]MCY9522681.1 sigma-70 family RNA polymerase sigma factor [Paenibacillus apiarius]MCY9555366.1 sigma-70 family RNA polymerase sigma factor [Paenibacillus apiarius]MCY9561246.1 sigma-70 family RNA polymerase sigma factor [Paenibacillus apiarius]MCY9686561.1 sigma-70 family RNA polymerase sigma factor [Paenibacillus apiarius]